MDDVARQAFAWIESVASPVEGGPGWQEDGQTADSLYSGSAGILLGCAEATAAGLAGLETLAEGARDRLTFLVRHAPGTPTMEDDGLFTGWAGAVVALRAWAAVTGDADARVAATELTGQVADRIRRRTADPGRCTDIVSGDAGILLALLPDDAAADACGTLADGLTALVEDRPDGLHWRMQAGWERLMPGFSHGTAGVAYALGAAGKALSRTDLIDVAVRAAEGLVALGDQPEGWALPLLIPPRPDRPSVNFGWCHGPTGTIRLFLLLDEIAPRPRWHAAVDACLQALRDSRLPERLYPGYWDNLARCCGTAGVGQVLLDRYRATGDPALLAWSSALAEDVIARRVPMPVGLAWSNTEHTATPPDLPPEPGFMQGAAGIAGWLARLAAPETAPVLRWV